MPRALNLDPTPLQAWVMMLLGFEQVPNDVHRSAVLWKGHGIHVEMNADKTPTIREALAEIVRAAKTPA